jgi:hypothetical protein
MKAMDFGARSAVRTQPEARRLSVALRTWRSSCWRRRALAAPFAHGTDALRTCARSLALLALLAALCSAAALAGEGPFRGKMLELTGSDESPVKVWGPDGKPVLDPYYAFDRKGLALLTRDYGLRLEGGSFYSGAAEDHLGGSLRNGGGELSVSGVIQPAAASQEGTGCILGYGPPKGELLFALVQEKDALSLRIGPSGAEPYKAELCSLKDAAPFHLTVTVARDAVVFYRDGKKAGAHPGIKGDFSGWANGILYFGNDRSGKLPWRGVVELAALHNRAVTADEAAKAAAKVQEELRGRAPVGRIEIEATLLSRPK